MFTALQALRIALGNEVTRRIGGVDFVHQHDLPVLLAELVLGVHQDEAFAGGDFRSALEQGQGVALQLLVFIGRNDAPGNDFFPGDILVMPFGRLGGGGDDGLGEFLVLAQAVGEGNAAEAAFTGLVLAPGMAGQVAAYHHFHLVRLAAPADGGHRVWHRHLPVGKDIGREIQELGGQLIQDLPFAGNAFREYHIEGGNTVGGHHYQITTAEGIHIAYFSRVLGLLTGKLELGFDNGVHGK